MNKTVLIVDDDDTLRAGVARGLRANNFAVLTAATAEIAQEILTRISVDIIVLDRMMDGIDGLTFLKKLRGAGNTTPVIMLTAMGGAENRIDGLAGGADDYMDKPFQLQELILRIENIIRRTPTANPTLPQNLIFIDDEFFVRTANGETKTLGLSTEEKKLLYNLITPIGNIVAAAPMVAKRLREKINDILLNTDIVTIRGRGYKLICTTPDRQDEAKK